VVPARRALAALAVSDDGLTHLGVRLLLRDLSAVGAIAEARGHDDAARLAAATDYDVVVAGACGPDPPASPAPSRPPAPATPDLTPADLVASLTPKEQEISSLVASGEPSKRIATRVGVSLRTVESHRTRVRAKLGVRSVASLTKLAVRAGLASMNAPTRG
jgi:DNA-binding CsgD family transcriptional regulator